MSSGVVGWGDVWTVAGEALAHDSIEHRIFYAIVALLIVVIFLEGIRSTFFRRMASPSAASSAADKPSRPFVGLSSARTWLVKEIAHTPDGMPRYVSAATSLALTRNRRRRLDAVKHTRMLLTGIHRKGPVNVADYEVRPALAPVISEPEPQYEEPAQDLRVASL